tara:strand:+ start:961 stop:1212 length:252 start_codon:yes stop_codon:yes gene_type:complete
LRYLGFRCQIKAAEVIDCTVVIFKRKEGAGVAAATGFVSPSARVQANASLAQSVQTHAYSALAEARLKVEHETLAPLFGFGWG